MEISDTLACLFTASVDRKDGSYVVEVPAREVDIGEIEANETYRVALIPQADDGEATGSTGRSRGGSRGRSDDSIPEPPVEEGEQRDVEIEDLGDKGDGIARVERGYVIIVPDTEPGDRVTIEISEVRKTVAFAEVVEREEYFH